MSTDSSSSNGHASKETNDGNSKMALSAASLNDLENDPTLMSYADLHGEWEDRVISIFGAVKSFISQLGIGQELTKVSMPSIFLMPYSILELAGSRYLKYIHLLSGATQEPDPIRRMSYVIQYFLACIRDGNFQKKPYNALLGETHTCFVRYPSYEGEGTSTARFVAEQVTHHPPLSAFHILTTDGIQMDCNVQFSAKFHMNSVSIVTCGDIIITIPVRDGDRVENEVYVIDKGLPDALVKNVIFGTRSIHWTDSVDIMCKTSNTSATLKFDKNEYVQGDIYNYNEEICDEEHHATLSGYLSSIVNVEYFADGDKPKVKSKSKKSSKSSKKHKKFNPTDTVLIDSEQLHPNKTQYPKQTDPITSLNVWKEVTKHIVANDMPSADIVKKEIEDEQRRRLRVTDEEEQKERKYFKFDEETERWIFKQDSIPPTAAPNGNSAASSHDSINGTK